MPFHRTTPLPPQREADTDKLATRTHSLESDQQSDLGPATPIPYEAFSDLFDRNFDRVWGYVSQRTSDRAVCERIVARVLESTLTPLLRSGASTRSGDAAHRDLRLLKAAADRLIGELEETSVLRRAPITGPSGHRCLPLGEALPALAGGRPAKEDDSSRVPRVTRGQRAFYGRNRR